MWEEFCRTANANIWRLPDGSLAERVEPAPAGILPGSFHPLHEGHRELRSAAEHWLKGPVYYEMTVTNADKPALTPEEIERRARQFTDQPLWITNAPTFIKKSEMLPGVVFIVGADTAERIVAPRFYGQSESAMREALERIRERGCRFLVAGRLVRGRFLTARDIAVPAEFLDLFEPLPETCFRRDVSSTKLRSGDPKQDEEFH